MRHVRCRYAGMAGFRFIHESAEGIRPRQASRFCTLQIEHRRPAGSDIEIQERENNIGLRAALRKTSRDRQQVEATAISTGLRKFVFSPTRANGHREISCLRLEL